MPLRRGKHPSDGDLDGWHRAWSSWLVVWRRALRHPWSADTLGARGRVLAGLHLTTGCPLTFMDPPTDDRFAAQFEHARSCFRRGAALSDPVIERVDVPCDAHTLPGYFVSAGSMSRRQDASSWSAAKPLTVRISTVTLGLLRRVAATTCSSFDLPGQGDLPSHGLVMRPDAEAPIGAALDYVTRRADVDDARIALLGLGAGGYLAPRAAAFDRRVAACVACSLILVTHGGLGSRAPPGGAAPIFGVAQTEAREANPTCPAACSTYICWRWGVDSLDELRDVSADFVLDPSDIAYPLLNVMTQWEYDRFGARRKCADATQWWIPGGRQARCDAAQRGRRRLTLRRPTSVS